MNLLKFLLRLSGDNRRARLSVALVALTGIASGLINTLLLALINTALGGGGLSTESLIWSVAVCCLTLPVVRLVSEVLLIRLTASVVFDLRMNLSRRILAAPLRSLEELGTHRLLAALTDDVPAITTALSAVPLLCMHAAIVVGSLVYLGWLSGTVLVGVLCFMAFAVLTYQLPMTRALRYFRLLREKWDVLFKDFRALTEGTKELKLHRRRREVFLSQVLHATASSLRHDYVKGNTIYAAARSWGQALVFVLIGLLLFALPRFVEVSNATLTGYTLTLLYMMNPLEVILNLMPVLGRANVALQKIERLNLSFDAAGNEADAAQPAWERTFESLELRGITHSYYREREDNNFTLGPLDLTFRRGELVFLTGGNGSGKTTLLKLLTGLYQPESGEILLNGQTVGDEQRDAYRQNFSAVFSDFYLFESLLGLTHTELDAKARDYLALLQLDHKVRVENGALSTTDLSQGQRKRLALLTAYLEDRPVYVFDEWAADQDPSFKEVFYLHLLPELKARGKTVIVTSHDDQYYFVADRHVKLDYGRLTGAREMAQFPASVAEAEAVPVP